LYEHITEPGLPCLIAISNAWPSSSWNVRASTFSEIVIRFVSWLFSA
jgi:hypothetical protein